MTAKERRLRAAQRKQRDLEWRAAVLYALGCGPKAVGPAFYRKLKAVDRQPWTAAEKRAWTKAQKMQSVKEIRRLIRGYKKLMKF